MTNIPPEVRIARRIDSHLCSIASQEGGGSLNPDEEGRMRALFRCPESRSNLDKIYDPKDPVRYWEPKVPSCALDTLSASCSRYMPFRSSLICLHHRETSPDDKRGRCNLFFRRKRHGCQLPPPSVVPIVQEDSKISDAHPSVKPDDDEYHLGFRTLVARTFQRSDYVHKSESNLPTLFHLKAAQFRSTLTTTQKALWAEMNRRRFMTKLIMHPSKKKLVMLLLSLMLWFRTSSSAMDGYDIDSEILYHHKITKETDVITPNPTKMTAASKSETSSKMHGYDIDIHYEHMMKKESKSESGSSKKTKKSSKKGTKVATAAPSRSSQPSDVPSISSQPSHVPPMSPRPTSAKSWQKMGGEALPGVQPKEAFGYSVTLNLAGTRVAIGAPFWDYEEIVDEEIIVRENAGRISIYDWSVGERTWEEIDFPFINTIPEEKFGSDVALSSSGNRVAIRAVSFTQVYQTRLPFQQVGRDLFVDLDGVRQDAGSVAMSADGNRVAVGAIRQVPVSQGLFRGTVKIFDWDIDFLENDWFPVVDINSNNLFGYSVAFSSNGNRVAIGAPAHEEQESLDPVGTVSYVNIYDRNMRTGNWELVPQTLTQTLTGFNSVDGPAADYFGGSIDLSANGNRIVIGAPGVSTDLFTNTGIGNYVVIYEYNGVRWNQVGNTITGERKDDLFGSSVSISANGLRVAVGAPSNDETLNGAGQVRIFDWNGVDWVQVGEDLDGVAADDEFGSSVALSGDGVRVAGGAPGPEDTPKDGYVCIFEYV